MRQCLVLDQGLLEAPPRLPVDGVLLQLSLRLGDAVRLLLLVRLRVGELLANLHEHGSHLRHGLGFVHLGELGGWELFVDGVEHLGEGVVLSRVPLRLLHLLDHLAHLNVELRRALRHAVVHALHQHVGHHPPAPVQILLQQLHLRLLDLRIRGGRTAGGHLVLGVLEEPAHREPLMRDEQ